MMTLMPSNIFTNDAKRFGSLTATASTACFIVAGMARPTAVTKARRLDCSELA